MNKERTNLLTANPSFFRGIGRLLDLGSTRNVYNTSENPEEADFNAIKSDWENVGEDFSNVYEKVNRDIEQTFC
ncbi:MULTISPECIES: hypothetical protein [Enterococcus]|uniref:Uncharacterized protein n=1 Tax=Enterococcus hirae TaxID=1354 RepID=A0AB37IM67_ENTHR|nr:MULTISPECIES: hypothetical protein [Enterococcus]EGP4751509.1 hypothetical protein [Enterococcus faecium]EME8273785.1 hypothetical protein [Enterococcus faecium]EPI19395.1 hypothetical protein D352_02875 [Enterococcus faecium LA4B-2]PCE10088.1 hypothetical protein CKY13_00065 [Enterococcus hirae]PQB69790.1 hypothetical protein CUN32_01570 [Enterococcus faecium]